METMITNEQAHRDEVLAFDILKTACLGYVQPRPELVILNPFAGTGVILNQIATRLTRIKDVTAIESDPEKIAVLQGHRASFNLIEADLLDVCTKLPEDLDQSKLPMSSILADLLPTSVTVDASSEKVQPVVPPVLDAKFDMVMMDIPPDIPDRRLEYISHAMKFLMPGGVLVVAMTPMAPEALADLNPVDVRYIAEFDRTIVKLRK